MRQIRHTQHLAEHQLADVGVKMAGDVGGQALHFHFAQHLVQNSALGFHAHGFTLEADRHFHPDLRVHGDALQVDVQQLAVHGVMLPVHDHDLGLFLPRYRVLLGAVEHAGNTAAGAQPPRFILAARAVWSGLGFNNF